MEKFFEVFTSALAGRPEILGIVLICWIMYKMVTVKKPHKKAGDKTPYFDHVINAQLWGVKGLGLVIVIRAIGESVFIPWFTGKGG